MGHDSKLKRLEVEGIDVDGARNVLERMSQGYLYGLEELSSGNMEWETSSLRSLMTAFGTFSDTNKWPMLLVMKVFGCQIYCRKIRGTIKCGKTRI